MPFVIASAANCTRPSAGTTLQDRRFVSAVPCTVHACTPAVVKTVASAFGTFPFDVLFEPTSAGMLVSTDGLDRIVTEPS